MKLKRLLLSCVCSMALITSLAISASAAEVDNTTITPTTSSIGSVAQTYSDVIETKFRYTSDHRLQMRRWNATRGYWVDPEWITIGGPG